MFNKKIMVLTIILVSLFAVSTVSASYNSTSDIVSVEDTIEANNLNAEVIRVDDLENSNITNDNIDYQNFLGNSELQDEISLYNYNDVLSKQPPSADESRVYVEDIEINEGSEGTFKVYMDSSRYGDAYKDPYNFELKILDSNGQVKENVHVRGDYLPSLNTFPFDGKSLKPGDYTIKAVNTADGYELDTAKLTVNPHYPSNPIDSSTQTSIHSSTPSTPSTPSIPSTPSTPSKSSGIRFYPKSSDYDVWVSNTIIYKEYGGHINMNIIPADNPYLYSYCYCLKVYDSNNVSKISKTYYGSDMPFSKTFNLGSNVLDIGHYTIKIINCADNEVMCAARLTVNSVCPLYSYYSDYRVRVSDTIIYNEYGGSIDMNISPALNSIYKYGYYFKIYDARSNLKISQLYNGTNSTYLEKYNLGSYQLDFGTYTIKIFNYADNKLMSSAKLTVKSAINPSYSDYSVNVKDTIIYTEYGGFVDMNISPALNSTYKYCYYLKIFDSQDNLKISQLYNGTNSTYLEKYNLGSYQLDGGTYTMKIINYFDNKRMTTAELTVKSVIYPSYSDYSVNISDTRINYWVNGVINMNISSALDSMSKYCYYLKIYFAGSECVSQLYNSTNSTNSISYNVNQYMLQGGTYTMKIINYFDNNVMSTAKLIVNRNPSYLDYSVKISNATFEYMNGGIIKMSISPALDFHQKYYFSLKIYDSKNKEIFSYIYINNIPEYSKTFKLGSSSLKPGNYTVVIINCEDHEVMDSVNLTVNKLPTAIIASDITTTYKDDDYLVVTLTDHEGEPMSGEYLYINFNGTELLRTDTNGQVKISTKKLIPNTYVATITFKGNEVYEKSTTTVKVAVKKFKVSLSSEDISVVYNDNSYLVATLKDNEGNPLEGVTLSVNLNGIKSFTTDDNGQIIKYTKGLVPNNYTATITFNGNDYFENSSTSARVIIKKAEPILTSGNVDTIYNTNDYLVATLKDNQNKPLSGTQLTVILNGKTYTPTTDANGQIKISTKGLVPNNYTATITFNGNDYFEKSSTSAKVIIKKAETMLTSGNVDTIYNSNNYLVATLKDNQNKPLSGTQLTVILNGKTYTPTTDANGQIKISTNDLVPNNYTATITFGGNDLYEKSTAVAKVVINKTKVFLSSEDMTVVYNDNSYLVAYLKDCNVNPLGEVNIFVNINGIKTFTTDANGQVNVSTNDIKPASYVATITFDGNDYYDKSTTHVNLIVKKATPKITAKAKTFKKADKTKKYTVTLKNNKKLIKGVTVKITVNKKTYSAKTNSKGVATFKLTKLTKKGKFTATVKSVGNKYYNAKILKNVKITVK